MTRPNILLLTADDMGGDTPGRFGGPPGVTPTLDRLADEGTLFERAHVAAAVCQPSRSAIMTGRWPHRNGAEGFEPIRAGVPLLTTVLRDAGYATGILGKVEHLQPVEAFGWDLRRGMRELGMGRDPAAYGTATEEFLAEAGDRPWFLMANAHDPHRPFSGSDEERGRWSAEERAGYPGPSRRFDDDPVEVPGFLPDLPEVRREYREYLASSRRCDDVVAAVLAAVDRAGATPNTLVVFLSDNGIAVPFAKANCYLQSSRTPVIVRWPGVVEPGRRVTEEFVSALDLFPTFCAAAGIELTGGAEDVDGRTLLPLLRGEPDAGREAVVTVFHETAAKARYEMRCRQDARHGYIWNAWSDGETEYRAENMWGRTWPAMQAATDTDDTVAARAEFYRFRAPEELYDLRADPSSLHDLTGSREHRETLDRFRAELLAWMAETGDPLHAAYRDFLADRGAVTPA